AFGSFQNIEINAHGARQMYKSLDILGKAKAAKTQAGAEKLRADPRVQAHRAGDFLHISANLFAEIGDHVGVANFQGEKRIRGVFDKLGAVYGGNEERSWIAGRASPIMNWASKATFEDGAINLPDIRCGRFILDPNNNPIGMK